MDSHYLDYMFLDCIRFINQVRKLQSRCYANYKCISFEDGDCSVSADTLVVCRSCVGEMSTDMSADTLTMNVSIGLDSLPFLSFDNQPCFIVARIRITLPVV